MNPKHVTSLEVSKQLAEAGIVIESEYVWYTNGDNAHLLHTPDGMRPMASKTFSAPIATELFEIMPDGCRYGVNLVKLMSGYGAELTDYTLVQPEKTLEEKFLEWRDTDGFLLPLDELIIKDLAQIAEEHYKELSK